MSTPPLKMGEYPLSKIGVLCYEYCSIKHGAISSYAMRFVLCDFSIRVEVIDEQKKI
jgi:hypothetical protein